MGTKRLDNFWQINVACFRYFCYSTHEQHRNISHYPWEKDDENINLSSILYVLIIMYGRIQSMLSLIRVNSFKRMIKLPTYMNIFRKIWEVQGHHGSLILHRKLLTFTLVGESPWTTHDGPCVMVLDSSFTVYNYLK